LSEAVLYETDAGAMVVQDGDVLASQPFQSGDRDEKLTRLGQEAKHMGVFKLKVASIHAKEKMEELGIETSIISDEEREALDSRRVELLSKAGFEEQGRAAFEAARERALGEAAREVSEASSREDLHLVNAIQALDEMDKFLNITTERTMEWYGLHFPELPDMIKDNLALAKLIIVIGRRGTFEKETLEKEGITGKKADAIMTASAESKGGTISERDMRRLVGLAEVAVKASSEREKLAEYVESSMNKIAPNITSVAGATIGARLIAKAGGLERMARLPASTIQVLGAEKALFRALRTGSRPPKHGILFQHEEVHTAPKWQRGKIARTIANKVAIAARIDYYRGEKAGDLTGQLEKRLKEIKTKYNQPPKARPEQRGFRGEQRPGQGKGRKAGRFYKKPRPGQEGVRRGPPRDRGKRV
jgi:nucleolar protein 56